MEKVNIIIVNYVKSVVRKNVKGYTPLNRNPIQTHVKLTLLKWL